MLSEHLTDDEQTEILGFALSNSRVDFLALMKETLDDLCAPKMTPAQIDELGRWDRVL